MNMNELQNQNHIKHIFLFISDAIQSDTCEDLRHFIKSMEAADVSVSYRSYESNVNDVSNDDASNESDKSATSTEYNLLSFASTHLLNDNSFLISDSIEACVYCLEHNIAHLLLLNASNQNKPLSGIKYAITDFDGIDLFYLNRVYERCHHIPWFIMSTDRCYLKELAPANLDALYDVYSDPEMTRYTEGLYEDRQQELQYMKDYITHVYEFSELGIWGIFKKDNHELIGRAGLSYREDFDTPELGYVIKKEYWKQGYAFEVCSAILRFSFQNYEFSSIRVLTHPDNTASIRLCEKLGFHFDKHLSIMDENYDQYILQKHMY